VEGALMQCGGKPRPVVVSTLPEAEMLVENGFNDVCCSGVTSNPLSSSLYERRGNPVLAWEALCNGNRINFSFFKKKEWHVVLLVELHSYGVTQHFLFVLLAFT
jgi:hypothetical protein